jgi:hypothetical protein
MGIWQDLLGTTATFFRVGKGGPGIKNNSGVIEVRNAADSAYSSLKASQLDIDANSNTLTLDAISTLAANTIVRFPGKSTDGFFLRQKAGTPANEIEFEFAAVANSADKVSVDTTDLNFGSSSPVTLFTLPANAVIDNVTVIVDTPFNGTPSLTVGITGTLAKYLTAQQVDLTSATGTSWVVHPGLIASASAESLIATYAAGGATVGAARVLIKYVVPT